jgi:hypothetical protein
MVVIDKYFDHFKLTMLRDPYSRIISHYHQVKPFGHYKGGNNILCRRSASTSFQQYLMECMYAHDFEGKYFGSDYDEMKLFMKKFDLVGLHEQYDEFLVMLHILYGFKVDEILICSDLKSRHEKSYLELKNNHYMIMKEYTRLDFQAYDLAKKTWDRTMSRLFSGDSMRSYATKNEIFVIMVKEYQELQKLFKDFIATNDERLAICKNASHPSNLLHLNQYYPSYDNYFQLRKQFCASDARCRESMLFYNRRNDDRWYH